MHWLCLLLPAAALAAPADFAPLAEALRSAAFVPPREPVRMLFVDPGAADAWQQGIFQLVEVQAPAERVVAALENVPGYVGLFDDLVKAEKRDEKGPDRYSIFTETEIPFPLVPNDKTLMSYEVTRAKKRTLFRFSLREGSNLKRFEGIAAVQAIDDKRSLYWELDLQEPGFGASRLLPAAKLWKESALANAQANWALKLRAEDPGRASASILEESRRKAEALKDAVDAAYRKPLSWRELLELGKAP